MTARPGEGETQGEGEIRRQDASPVEAAATPGTEPRRPHEFLHVVLSSACTSVGFVLGAYGMVAARSHVVIAGSVMAAGGTGFLLLGMVDGVRSDGSMDGRPHGPLARAAGAWLGIGSRGPRRPVDAEWAEVLAAFATALVLTPSCAALAFALASSELPHAREVAEAMLMAGAVPAAVAAVLYARTLAASIMGHRNDPGELVPLVALALVSAALAGLAAWRFLAYAFAVGPG